jgi:hypothetical protein
MAHGEAMLYDQPAEPFPSCRVRSLHPLCEEAGASIHCELIHCVLGNNNNNNNNNKTGPIRSPKIYPFCSQREIKTPAAVPKRKALNKAACSSVPNWPPNSLCSPVSGLRCPRPRQPLRNRPQAPSNFAFSLAEANRVPCLSRQRHSHE